MPSSAKIVLTVLTFVFSLLILPSVTFATTATPAPSTGTTPTTNSRGPNCTASPGSSAPTNGEAITPSNYTATTHANFTLINIQNAIFCQATGFSFICGKCVSFTGQGQFVLLGQTEDGGTIGSLSKFMASMYENKPISTSEYLADIGLGLGVVKEASAQENVPGSGNGVLKPVIKLWTAAKNLSFLAYILIFLITGFMIMFRQKLNPQTVISIQAALPRLVLGLILIYFSYFLAALIVDFSFVVMQLVSYFFTASGITYHSADSIDRFAQHMSFFQIFGSFLSSLGFSPDLSNLSKLFWVTSQTPQGLVVGNPAAPAEQMVLAPALGPIIAQNLVTLGSPGTGGLNIMAAVIILIAVIIQFFRLTWALISSYIAILIVCVFGPFIILLASIPGRGSLLGLWWKTLLANVLVFPAVFATFLFAGAVLGETGDFRQTLPLLSGIRADFFRFILGLGIILLTPQVPGLVKNLLGVTGMLGGSTQIVNSVTSVNAQSKTNSLIKQITPIANLNSAPWLQKMNPFGNKS